MTPAPERKRILSGMRPTGALHIGHLAGALDNWVRLEQAGNECYHFVADWHALTTDYADPSNIRANTTEMIVDWLAAGLDPTKSVVFRQSRIKQHAELYLLLNMITPLGWLERNPTYKEQREEITTKDLGMAGFLSYPVLQAADILMYKAHAVPVGKDQLPHLEFTRELVRRFTNFYGEVFPEPEALLTPVPKIPGTDGRKMSKSYGNAILLKDTPAETEQKLKPMVTDPARKRRTDPGEPTKCPVFDLHNVYSGDDDRAWAAHGCRTAEIGCIDCKMCLAKNMNAALADLRARRAELAAHPDRVAAILADGEPRARAVAEATMEEVREVMQV